MRSLLKAQTQLLLTSIAIPFKYKDNEPWQRYDVTRKTDGRVIKDIMQAFFGINRLNDTVKVTATDNKFIADTPNKNGFFRLYNGDG